VISWFNPGTQTLNFNFKSSETATLTFRIYGLDGRQLVNQQVHNYGQTHHQIQLQKLSKGLYIFEVNAMSTNGIWKRATGKVVL